MKILLTIICLLVAGCQMLSTTTAPLPPADAPDLAEVEAVEPGQVYRVSESGIFGTVDDGSIHVTAVMPGSPADGKLQAGDRVVRLQYRPLGSDVRRMVAKRIGRLGRDWHWKLYVTVERDSALGGEGNTLTFPLTLPPTKGIVHHFGPTGIYAKIYPHRLVVDRIAKGSPADGRLQVGDAIIAVVGEPIAADVFGQWTRHIDAAENKAAGGILLLTIQRQPATNAAAPADDQSPSDVAAAPPAPETLDVSLQLTPMGTYSDTYPIDCPKTEAIITRAADAVIANESYDRLNIALLGLLATGEQKYIDHVGRVLRASDFASPDVEPDIYATTVAWRFSYTLIMLSEYYLLTGDTYVLPAIERYAVAIAKGQDVAGLWNHRGANPNANFGQLHGRLYGYGAINQSSVSLWIGLILAQKCGIDHPEVQAAITRTQNHYRNWVDRGSLPYGNHGYVEYHLTNNGSSGSAAVAFLLLGDRDAAKFFAKMSAAAHDEILTGHTGPFFNILWSGLGANVLGPETAAAFARKIHWLRTMARRANGEFHYFLAGGDRFEYGQSSSTGAHLLNLCVGRRALHITGKSADTSLWLTGEAAQHAVDAGKIRDTSRQGLLASLGDELPRVRLRAAQLLAATDSKVTTEVMRMLTEGNRNEKIGAIHAVAHLRIASADDALWALASDKAQNLWVRVLAIQTLAQFEDARRFAPGMLKLVMQDKPYDPRQDIDAALGRTLVELLGPDPLAHGLDRDLFFMVVNKLLDHRRMVGRGAGMALIKNIAIEDLPEVAHPMIEVIKDRDRSYTSYHGDGHRQAGLEILNRLNIQEVVPLTVKTIREPTGRAGPRIHGRLKLLETFDANAKPYIPRIREALGKRADEIVKAIEAAKTQRQMIPLEQVLQGESR